MNYRSKLAALGLLVSAPAASQMSEPQMLEAAKSVSKLLQLSPAGTERWARQTVKRAISENYDDVTKVEMEIGRELARASPDRRHLDMLVEQYAAKSVAIERVRKRKELDDAFELTPSDRQKIGQFIETSAQSSLNNTRSVLQPLP